MSDQPLIPVTWRSRVDPLAPSGMIARDEIAVQLAERILRDSPKGLERLKGIVTQRELVLLGEPEALPWVDGVRYVGRCPEAPALFLPTTMDCSPHPQLVFSLLLVEAKEPPILVYPPWSYMLSLGQATIIHPPSLDAWAHRLRNTVSRSQRPDGYMGSGDL